MLLRKAARQIRSLSPTSTGGNPWTIPSNAQLAGWTAAGVPITQETAMQLLVVSSCVRILSNTVGGLPLDEVAGKGAERRTIDPPSAVISDPFGGANKINGITRRDGFARMMVSLCLRGNAYALVTMRDHLERPTRLMVLHPDAVRVKVNPYSGEREYEINRKPVPSVDMVHLVGMSEPGAPEGMSVLSYARNAIGLGLAAEQFGSSFFGKGANLTGIIQIPGDLDRKKARGVKENFEASHSGLQNAFSVGVLTAGAEWKPISVSPEDAQFLGTRAAQNLDIAMLFGIPPHMLGQVDRSTSWGKGIEEQKLGFLTFTLSDWTGRFEDTWSAMLPKPRVARFNMDAFLRADTKTRYGAYGQARTASFLTINEIRALENMGPVDGGDTLFAPLNSAHTINTVTDDNDDDLDDDGQPSTKDDAPSNPKKPSPGAKSPSVKD